ncbi:MAG: hypothetical protein ACYTBJ_25065 [Planctomycetota bacterium]|jgi:Flp pilus assembly secretin CpaC
MSIRKRKICHGRKLVWALSVNFMALSCGCGDFFAQKPTEIQSRRIREEVRTIRRVADPNIPIPDIYQAPPKIVEQMVGGGSEWKLFYFCRHHTAGQLSEMVNQQFAHKVFDEKGKSTTLADYTVSSNPATNQLVARCPTRNDIDAVLEFLEMVDVPPIQVKIDCLISEIYADKTLDWETTLEIGDLLGEDITMGGSAQLWGSDVIDLVQEHPPLPAFPGASLREVARSKMGLKIGYLSEKHDFLALVDLLESKGYLKVLMNPSLEVVNGQKARIESSEKVPLEQVFLRDRDGFVESRLEYIDVVDALEVIPHVFADGYIGLETTALIGSKSVPEGVKQVRIVTKREIYNKENRIRQGESLVIGGIRKSEEHSVVRGVPLLKDIPGLGVLFSSKDYEERAVETIFILTPTISTGGIPNAEMVERIRRKHQRPEYPDEIQDAIKDPLGFDAREEEHERKLQELEKQQREAAIEKQKARRGLREAEAEVQQATAAVQKAREEVVKAQQSAEAEKKKAAEAVSQAEEATTKAERIRAEAEKAMAEAEKAKAEAEKAIAEAERAKAEAIAKAEENTENE